MARGDDALLRAIEAGPPAGGGSGSGPSPIGVPKDFIALRPTKGPPAPGRQVPAPAPVPPRYMDGFQFTPATWAPEDVARLQEMLDASGLYDPDDVYQRGWFNATDGSSPDIKAFKRLLTQANATGMDFESTAINLATQAAKSRGMGGGPGGTGGRGRTRPSVTVEITSSADIRELANRVAKKSIGKKLDEDQLNRFMQAYQGMEQGEAQSRIAAAGAPESVIRTAAPSPETFAQGQIQQQMPEEVRARKFVEKFDVVHNMLGGLPGLEGAGTVS